MNKQILLLTYKTIFHPDQKKICNILTITGEVRDKQRKPNVNEIEKNKEMLASLFQQGKGGATDMKALEYVKD